jgi:hypothetical protein
MTLDPTGFPVGSISKSVGAVEGTEVGEKEGLFVNLLGTTRKTIRKS